MSDDHHIPTAASRDPNLEPSERLARPFQRFASLSSSGGIVLLLMTAIAMIWANMDFRSYDEIFNETEIRVTVAHNPHGDAAQEHGETPHTEDLADEVGDELNTLAEEAGLVDDHAEIDTHDSDTTHATDEPEHDSSAGHDEWHPLPNPPHWWQGHPIAHWINDLLMAVFFLVVGLEIKREILVGELASPKRAALPIFGALGGMIGPALIFVGLNLGKDTIGGWGVPMATDIAFAVGILAMLGSRIPNSLKVFLTSLAIVDDLGALIVIAVFYTENLQLQYLGYAGTIVAVLMFLNVLRCRWITLYLVLGLPLWYCIYMSGVHATIAGVLLAMTIPAHARVNAVNFVYSTRKALDVFQEAHDDPNHDIKESSIRRAAVNAIMKNARQVLPPLHRIEYVVHPWAAFFIIPIFALANAGIPVHGGVMDNLTNSVSLGIILGLFLGKPLGILAICFLATKIGLASLPRGVSWRHMLGAGALGGIGFTMAIFIANLAFKNNPSHLEHAKLAILVASAISAVFGGILLLSCKSAPEPEPEQIGPEVNPDDD
ncbi:MAG: Na+/H+ antiporter NhaA [Phycisphaerales bacterium]|nr:Na+/H+ antiporter NhaA [Phycisphaerales bacterium]